MTIILTKENAAKTFASWKKALMNTLDEKPMPKFFFQINYTLLGSGSLETPTTPAVAITPEAIGPAAPIPVDGVDFMPLSSHSDFLLKDIPPPQRVGYTNTRDYLEANQKYKQVTAAVRVVMKGAMSPELNRLFEYEASCFEGYNALLREVKFDEAIQVKLLKRKLENISQTSKQTLKEYADDVNSILIDLAALGFPKANQKEDFMEDLADRFLNGIAMNQSLVFRALFKEDKATSFQEMRSVIVISSVFISLNIISISHLGFHLLTIFFFSEDLRE
jgi:hypothetical protein